MSIGKKYKYIELIIKMQTRSQAKYPVIDFDEAHTEWIKNKKKIGNGTYVYICGKPLKNGVLCKNIDTKNGCSIHTFWEKQNK